MSKKSPEEREAKRIEKRAKICRAVVGTNVEIQQEKRNWGKNSLLDGGTEYVYLDDIDQTAVKAGCGAWIERMAGNIGKGSVDAFCASEACPLPELHPNSSAKRLLPPVETL